MKRAFSGEVLVRGDNTFYESIINFATRAAAEQGIPPADATVITISSWGDDSTGGAKYKASNATEVAPYPTLAWFQSADERYWLLDEEKPAPAMLGGHRHASFDEMTHDDAVDATAEIKACRQYANERGVPWIVDGFYQYRGQFRFDDDGETMLGIGQWLCGIECRMGSTETGPLVAADNITVLDVGFRPYLTEPKPSGGGTGMIGCGFILGYYLDSEILLPNAFNIDRVMVTRKPNETGHISYNAYAFQVGAGSNQGYGGTITVTGRHSCAYQSHWDGNNTTTTGNITATEHPRNFVIDTLLVLGQEVTIGMTLSATSCISIRNVFVDTCRSLFNFLAGDEVDDVNEGYPNVGAANRIGTLQCNHITTTNLSGSNDEALALTSLGTSKFRTADGASKPYKDQLRCDVEIDTLCIHTDDPALLYGIDLFGFYGRFVVNSARITGFRDCVRVRYCKGEIDINLEYTDGRLNIDDSDVIIRGQSDRGDPTGMLFDESDLNESCNVRVAANPWSVAASDITRRDTSITIPTRIGGDVFKGTTFEVTGTTSEGVETLQFVSKTFTESQPYTRIQLGYELTEAFTDAEVSGPGNSNRAILDADIGDTYLVVPNGLAVDVEIGDVLTIHTDGGAVTTDLDPVTVLTPSNTNTEIKLGFPFPHDMTGVTFNYVENSNVTVLAKDMTGSRIGVYATGGTTKVRGDIRAGRYNVLKEGENTFVDYEITSPVSGAARELTENYSIYDFFSIDGGNAVISGKLGAAKVSGVGSYYSVGASGSPDTNVHLKNAEIVDPALVIPMPDNEVVLTATNCFETDGTPWGLIEYEGLTRSGSWTPTIEIGGSDTGISYSQQQGNVEIIGSLVWASFDIILDSKGGLSGTVKLTGLPAVQEANGDALGTLQLGSYSGATDALTIRAQNGTFTLQRQSTSGVSSINGTDLADSSRLTGSIVYRRA